MWFGLETSLVTLFTVGYVARCATTSYSWSGLFGWVSCASFLLFFTPSLQLFCLFFSFGAVTMNPDFVINTSVLWNYGPSGYPSLLHRDRTTKGHRQSFAFESSMHYLIRCVIAYSQSTLFRFSILRTFRLLRVFRPFRYNSTLLLCVPFLFNVSSPTDVRSREVSTIEVMYLSFRRSRDALLALGFFVLMVVIVFSTLLYVRVLFSLCWPDSSQSCQGILSSAAHGTTPSNSSSTSMAIHPNLRLVLNFPFFALHVFLTTHILVHTRRSVVCHPFPVQSPLPDVHFARRFVIVSK
jgi:hypothetical protein